MILPGFDPQAVPIAAVSSDPAIEPALLTRAALVEAFVAPRTWQIEVTDESRAQRLREGAEGPVAAAVLVPIVMRGDGPTVLFTQRTAHLNDHAGQISFPGGSSERADASPFETALRETEEEIGLARAHVEIIGRLPDYPTVTGFNVTPVVALVTPPFELVLDDFEVAEAFEVPLSFLMDPAHHQRHIVHLADGSRTFTSMPYGRYFIWGATAAMLRNLYHFLFAQLAH